MLTSKEKEFLENNRSFIESKPSLTDLSNRVASDLGIVSGKKLSVLYAESVGGYRFRVKVNIRSTREYIDCKILYSIESLSDVGDRLELDSDSFPDLPSPSLEFQIRRLGVKLKNLDSTFELRNFKNLFDSAQYSEPRY
jgi:hypothetical protein